jgi:hypothetical protein
LTALGATGKGFFLVVCAGAAPANNKAMQKVASSRAPRAHNPFVNGRSGRRMASFENVDNLPGEV